MTAPRIVGIDYGARRVGIALADPLRMFARPLGTYAPGESLQVLADLDASDGVEVVVVGWPLDEDGEEGPAVDRIRPFLGRVRKLIPDAQVTLQDETLSSRRAMDDLVAADVSRKRRRQRGTLDAAAACVILQDWLDERAPESGE